MISCSAGLSPAATLRALREDLTGLGAWAEVVADLLRQLERDTAGDEYYASEAHRRAPGAGLHRYLEIRDRSCTMIGCRAPARTADKDHTVDHGHGGPTTGPNLGDACRHDHRLKHQGGWRLHQPQPRPLPLDQPPGPPLPPSTTSNP